LTRQPGSPSGHGLPVPRHVLAGVATIIGSLDIIFDEIDR